INIVLKQDMMAGLLRAQNMSGKGDFTIEDPDEEFPEFGVILSEYAIQNIRAEYVQFGRNYLDAELGYIFSPDAITVFEEDLDNATDAADIAALRALIGYENSSGVQVDGCITTQADGTPVADCAPSVIVAAVSASYNVESSGVTLCYLSSGYTENYMDQSFVNVNSLGVDDTGSLFTLINLDKCTVSIDNKLVIDGYVR
ncbi:hypothetical protein KIPB_014489, partial [Kipferlia bialata]